MSNILTLNKIAKCGTRIFGDKYVVTDTCENPDAIMLRSFNMHDMELGDNLKAVARAGAGVNNIPLDKCAEQGIVVFNTPGANANAVKELVLTGMLLASRHVIDANTWAKTLNGEGENVGKLVEKGKSQFVGHEIKGKTLAVIGLGAIGVLVANAAHSLGMDVIGYDPYISVKSALGLSRAVKIVQNEEDALKYADFVTVHVPLNDNTRGSINEEMIKTMKHGIVVLNYSRDALVNDADMKAALESGKVSAYVTDFPNQAVLEMPNVIALPHIGASTEESEDNCATMAASQLLDFLENGNIVNSVNYPECVMPREEGVRITIAHKNIPNMVSSFSGILAGKGLNIENMLNKSKKDYAYTIIDVLGDSISEDAVAAIGAIDGVLKVRVIK